MGPIAKLKAFFALRKIKKEATREVVVNGQVKQGWKTTEFWGKTLVQLIVLYNSLFKGSIDPQAALTIVAGLEGIYTGGRAVVKSVKDVMETRKPSVTVSGVQTK